MRILLANDDGVNSLGILALKRELSRLGQVIVVAPLEEKSTTGHALTIHKPIRLKEIGKDVYGVSGTPADCVYLALKEFYGARPPDLVVSGINRGANLGQDVYYSGTVAAARQAVIQGVPGISVSCVVDFKNLREDKINYASSAKMARKIINRVFGKIPEHTLININVPDLPLAKIKGIRVGHQGFRKYSDKVVKRQDHKGKEYYWVGGQYMPSRREMGSDCSWLEENYASVTPMELDTTHYGHLETLAHVLS